MLLASVGALNAQVFIDEDFSTASGTTPPTGWSNYHTGASGTNAAQIWEFDDPGFRFGFDIPGSLFDTDFAILDSDNYGSGNSQSGALETPYIDLTAVTRGVRIKFDEDYQSLIGDAAFQQYTIDSGLTWVTYRDVTGADINEESFDTTFATVLQGNVVKFRWIYEGSFSWWYAIDNVTISLVNPIELSPIAVGAVPGCPSGCDPLTVEVENTGTAVFDASLNSLRIQGTVVNPGGISTPFDTTIASGTIPANGSLNFQVLSCYDLTLAGNYSINATISSTADVDTNNNNLVQTFGGSAGGAVQAFPYTENFDSYSDGSNTFGPWTTTNSPGSLTTNPAWTVETAATGSSGTGPSGPSGGSGAYVYMETSSPATTGDEAIMTTPCIDLNSAVAPIAKFDYHMFGSASDMGTLFFEGFLPGTGWTTIWSRSGPAQTATTDPWITATVDLLPYVGTVTQFRFRGVHGGTGFTGDMAVDELRIFERPNNDLAVTRIFANGSGNSCGGTYPVSVELTNFGLNTWDFVANPVTLNVDVFDPAGNLNSFTVTVNTGSIPVAGSTLGSTAPVAFTTAGTYDLSTSFTSAFDQDPSNNSLSENGVFFRSNVSGAFSENFDALTPSSSNDGTNLLAAGYEPIPVGGFNDGWWIENVAQFPTTTGPATDVSGTGNYVQLDGGDVSGDTAILVLPCFDFSSFTRDPEIVMGYHMFGAQIGLLQIEVDTGTGWFSVWSLFGQQQTSESDAWRYANVLLSGYRNSQVGIRIVGTKNGDAGDIAIDDIRIREQPTQDLGITNLSLSGGGNNCGGTVPIDVELTNNGVNAWNFSVDPITVNVDLFDPVTGLTTLTITRNTGTLASGASTTLSTAPQNFNTPGLYDLLASFTSTADQDPANNTFGQAGLFVRGTITGAFSENFDALAPSSSNDGTSLRAAGYEVIPVGGFNDGWWIENTPQFPNTTGPATDASGSGNYVQLDGGDISGDTAILILPCFDFSSYTRPPEMVMAYHMFGSDIGTLRIDIDTGFGWQTAWSLSGEQQTSESSPWRFATVSFPGLTQSNVTIRILGTKEGNDGDIAIDDIRVREQPVNDLSVSDVSINAGANSCGGSVPIDVELTNTGINAWDFTTDPITINVDIFDPVAGIVTVSIPANSGTVASGATVTFSSTPQDFTNPGTYDLLASFSSAADQDPANNSFSVAGIFIRGTFTGRFFEDFDALSPSSSNDGTSLLAAGYEPIPVGSFNDGWWIENVPQFPTTTGPDVDVSGSGNYVQLDGSDTQGDTAILILPCFDFSGFTNDPQISLGYHMFGDDIGTLQIDVNTGSGWTTVWSLSGEQQTSATDAWRFAEVNLVGNRSSSASIRILGTKDGADGDIAFDEVLVREQLNFDLGFGDAFSPTVSGRCRSTTETVSLELIGTGDSTYDIAANPVTITGDITNPGGVATPFSVTVNTGTLASGDTLVVDLNTSYDLGAAGTYSVDATLASAADGDASNNNGILNFSFAGTGSPQFPYSDNFDSYTASTLGQLNYGDWLNEKIDAAPNWEIDNNQTGSSGTGPDGPSGGTGAYAFMETSGGSQGDEATLVSPCIDLTTATAPIAKFDYHMFGATMGDLFFEVSTPTGWVTLWSRSGQQQTALSDPWLSATVNLAPYIGNTVTVRFRGVRGSSFTSDMAIDQFRVIEAPNNDIGITEFFTGAGTTRCGGIYPVDIEVTNFGQLPWDFSANPVTLNVDVVDPSGTFNNFTVNANSGTVPTGGTIVFSTAPVDFSTPGQYDILGTFSSTFDQDATNNNLSRTGLTFSQTVVGAWSENFDGLTPSSSNDGSSLLAAGYVPTPVGGFNDGWWIENIAQFPTTTGPAVDASGSGNYVQLDGSDVTGDTAFLRLPCFDFSTYTQDPEIRLGYHMFGADIGLLGIEVDTGMGWMRVWSLSGEQQTAETDAWRFVNIVLAGYRNPSAQIRIVGTKEGADGDIAIDELRVRESQPFDLTFGVVSGPDPSARCRSTCETFAVELVNAGNQPYDIAANPVTITGDITDPAAVATPLNLTVNSGVLAVGDTLVVLLDTCYDVTAEGNYSIDIDLASAADGDSSNNDVVGTFNYIGDGSPRFPFEDDFDSYSPSGTGQLSYGSWLNVEGSNTPSWRIEDGTTISGSTGPSGPSGGTGNYIYLETSGGITGDEATLVSPCIAIPNLSVVEATFDYHMFGAAMGELFFEGFHPDSGGWVTLFSRIGQQQTSEAAPWNNVVVDLAAFRGLNTTFRFRGVRGTSFTSDMAIDEFAIYAVAPNDVSVDRINTSLINSLGCLGANTPIEIEFSNLGTQDLDGSTAALTFTVELEDPSGVVTTFTQPVPSTLFLETDSSASLLITPSADFSAVGSYRITAYSSWILDSVGINDTVSTGYNVVKYTSFPVAENFDLVIQANDPTIETEFNNGWKSVATSNPKWRATTSSPSSNTGPSQDNTTGFGSFFFLDTDGPGSLGQSDTLFLPCVDLGSATDGFISFRYHMFGAGMGTLKVIGDTGTGWVELWSLSGQQQGVATAPWDADSVQLNSFPNKDAIELAFVGERGTSSLSFMAIDDINIRTIQGVDVRPVAFSSPFFNCGLNLSTTVSFLVVNNGFTPVNALSYDYVVGGVTTSETFTLTSPAAQGDTFEVTIPTPFDFSSQGAYPVTIYTTQPSDASTSNDTLRRTFYKELPPFSVVTFDGFAGDNLDTLFPGWSEGAQANPGGVIRPNAPSVYPDAGTNNAAVFDYSFGDDDYIISPSFIANSQSGFAYRIASQQDVGGTAIWQPNDRFEVLVSDDCGDTWTVEQTYNGFNTTTSFANDTVDLSAYNGQEIIVAMRSIKRSTSSTVWVRVDDLSIFSGLATDVGVTAIISPDPFTALGGGTSVVPAVEISNLGTSSVTGVPATIDLNGTLYSATFAGTIAPGASVNLNLNPTAVTLPSGVGSYPIVAYTTLVGDQQPQNDTLSTNFVISIKGLQGDGALAVYPNPASDKLFAKLSTDGKDVNATVEIISIDGRTVIDEEMVLSDGVAVPIELSAEMPNGQYILKIVFDNKVAVQRFVKE